MHMIMYSVLYYVVNPLLVRATPLDNPSEHIMFLFFSPMSNKKINKKKTFTYAVTAFYMNLHKLKQLDAFPRSPNMKMS